MEKIKLKPISKEAIGRSLERAMRYRLLNDPWQAESICRDVLSADPENQEATYILILSITDQFGTKLKNTLQQVLDLTAQLKDTYQRDYCRGIIFERNATMVLKKSIPRAHYIAYEYLVEAMEWYEKAEKLRPENNDDSILRWNACVRRIEHFKLEPAPKEEGIQPFLDV
jgi:tetratricopeptide (TPR) repeat protein